jgi:hypothetical protein
MKSFIQWVMTMVVCAVVLFHTTMFAFSLSHPDMTQAQVIIHGWKALRKFVGFPVDSGTSEKP